MRCTAVHDHDRSCLESNYMWIKDRWVWISLTAKTVDFFHISTSCLKGVKKYKLYRLLLTLYSTIAYIRLPLTPLHTHQPCSEIFHCIYGKSLLAKFVFIWIKSLLKSFQWNWKPRTCTRATFRLQLASMARPGLRYIYLEKLLVEIISF